MTIIEEHSYQALAHEEDPDDFRPNSELAIEVDPSDGDGRFCEGVTVFHERIAEGDRIPLHQHTVEEVLFVDEGQIEARVGNERRVVGSGATVFVPALTPHGFENVGEGAARIHAVFATNEITIKYLERNPAPGTEGDPPGPPLALDVRELVEGDPERAVRPVSEALFESE
jgi:quercetin dioxygenase-like cupin family protein